MNTLRQTLSSQVVFAQPRLQIVARGQKRPIVQYNNRLWIGLMIASPFCLAVWAGIGYAVWSVR